MGLSKILEQKNAEIEALTLLCEGKDLSKAEKDAEINKLNIESADLFLEKRKLEKENQKLKDIKNYWINAITGELCFRQRILGKVTIEDGKLIKTTRGGK